VRIVAILGAALAAVTLSLEASSGASAPAVREGGTFRVAVAAGFLTAIDPALDTGPSGLTRPVCGTLMSYPDKPPPAGFRLAPELAEADPAVTENGRTYTWTIRKDARFSTGASVTARAFERAIERILDPAMKAPGASDLASIIVGGDDVLAGKAVSPTGVIARGRTLILRLTKRVPDLPESWIDGLCAVPPNLPADPEGAKAPLPSAAPYYVAQYVPGVRLVLERNRFYKGKRPHHVNRFVADLGVDEGSVIDEIASGKVDWGFVSFQVWGDRAAELARRYGVNKSRFFVKPGGFVRMFVLNTSRPLFQNNVKLRRAVNFAVNRVALTRELGTLAGTPTDQYLRLRNERIYPLKGPDLRRARALARGNLRGGKAVLYTRSTPVDVAQAQVLQENLGAIGIKVDIDLFPGQLIFDKLATGRNDFDIGRVAWGNPLGGPSPPTLLNIFDGRTIGGPDNTDYSYFNSPKYNRLLDQASRLSGPERYRTYGKLDVQLSRDAAPAIPVAFLNSITFVSTRAGCIVLNPYLDLTAVCLK
jgi:peptide/nickel transport system substrate-binding protein